MGTEQESKKCGIQYLIKVHLFLNQIIPSNGSMIPVDLLLCLASSYFSKKNLTQKELFASLPYSSLACRHHLQRLLDKELIYFENDSDDLRKKSIILSVGLKNKFDEFDQMLSLFKSSKENFDFEDKKITETYF